MCPACGCIGPNPGYEKLSEEDLVAEYATLKQNAFWTMCDGESVDGGASSLKRQFKCRRGQSAN